MLFPGAATSIKLPTVEKLARASVEVVALTVRTYGLSEFESHDTELPLEMATTPPRFIKLCAALRTVELLDAGKLRLATRAPRSAAHWRAAAIALELAMPLASEIRRGMILQLNPTPPMPVALLVAA